MHIHTYTQNEKIVIFKLRLEWRHIYSLSTHEAKTGGFKFKVNLIYRAIPFPKDKRKRKHNPRVSKTAVETVKQNTRNFLKIMCLSTEGSEYPAMSSHHSGL